jgi:hypothetical protein
MSIDVGNGGREWNDSGQGLHEAIQASQAENDRLDGAILVGWFVIGEWLGRDGTRSLVRMSGTAGGTLPPEWQTRGYLHEALFGSWNGDA